MIENNNFLRKQNCRQFLIPSHEVYLSYHLFVCYETSGGTFMVILSFFRGMYFDILAEAFILWLTF